MITVSHRGPDGNVLFGTIDWKADQEELWDFLLDYTEPQQGPGRDDYPDEYETGWVIRTNGKRQLEIDVPGVDLDTNTVSWREI